MNTMQKLAKTNPEEFKKAKRNLELESRKYTDQFKIFYEDQTKSLVGDRRPVKAWRNRHFLAAIYFDSNETVRLTVNRTKVDNDGHFVGGITWDELMDVKRGIGMDGVWMVEVFPPAAEVINVANMRHLWIIDEPPFAWTKAKAEAKRQKKPAGIIARALVWLKIRKGK